MFVKHVIIYHDTVSHDCGCHVSVHRHQKSATVTTTAARTWVGACTWIRVTARREHGHGLDYRHALGHVFASVRAWTRTWVRYDMRMGFTTCAWVRTGHVLGHWLGHGMGAWAWT